MAKLEHSVSAKISGELLEKVDEHKARTGENRSELIARLLDEYLNPGAEVATGVSEEQFTGLREEFGQKLGQLHRLIQYDLAQFYKAVLLNPEIHPDGEQANDLLQDILDKIFPNK